MKEFGVKVWKGPEKAGMCILGTSLDRYVFLTEETLSIVYYIQGHNYLGSSRYPIIPHG